MVNSYLLDSDVVLDFLLKRTPFNVVAKELFTLALNEKIEICISSLAIANIYYLLQKAIGKAESLILLREILNFSKILSVGQHEIMEAIISDFLDLEDSIQHQTALNNTKIKGVITRNIKDFKKSKLPVYSPESFLSLFK
jgi:predicted nucleic acid-binding protein